MLPDPSPAEYLTGWMGGWALSSWPPFRGTCHIWPLAMAWAWAPQLASCVCACVAYVSVCVCVCVCVWHVLVCKCTAHVSV